VFLTLLLVGDMVPTERKDVLSAWNSELYVENVHFGVGRGQQLEQFVGEFAVLLSDITKGS